MCFMALLETRLNPGTRGLGGSGVTGDISRDMCEGRVFRSTHPETYAPVGVCYGGTMGRLRPPTISYIIHNWI